MTRGIRKTIKDMQKLAMERGGRCLSDTYIDARTKILWECKKGHQWQAAPAYVQGGTWCPECAGNTKLTIEDVQKLAREKGGKCLSTEYKNKTLPLVWECAEGHRWELNLRKIKEGRWCPMCAGKK